MSDYVFKRDGDTVEYVGDFDGLYANDTDPWGQSALLRADYSIPRGTQFRLLEKYKGNGSLLDIGCGLGYTTDIFSKRYEASGCDISRVAIEKAMTTFPSLEFSVMDIRREAPQRTYDIFVLNHLLWYVLNDMDAVFGNIRKATNENSIILLTNFLLASESQKYGNHFFRGPFEITAWLASVCSTCGLEIREYTCSKLESGLYDFHALLCRK